MKYRKEIKITAGFGSGLYPGPPGGGKPDSWRWEPSQSKSERNDMQVFQALHE
jgi:hypothetical protein